MKNCALLMVIFTFCIIKINAQTVKEVVKLKKDSINIDRTFEDRIVSRTDYVNDTFRRFYNRKWEEVDNFEITYYSIAYKKDGGWVCYDYYVPENKIFHYVAFSDQELKHKQGLFVSYTPDSDISEIGYYQSNQKTGNWLSYSNGRAAADTTFYKNGLPVGRSITHSADGKILSIQEMDTIGKGEGKQVSYYDYEKGIVQETGLYSEGMKKDSIWTYFYPNGKVSFVEKYDTGALRKTSCYDMNGISLDSCIVNMVPEYPGGLPALMKFLSENVRYPSNAREDNIQGKVVVQFIIDKDGSVADIKIKRDIGGGCGKEAARVVGLMPLWKPGAKYGNPVRVYYTLPVSFKLER